MEAHMGLGAAMGGERRNFKSKRSLRGESVVSRERSLKRGMRGIVSCLTKNCYVSDQGGKKHIMIHLIRNIHRFFTAGLQRREKKESWPRGWGII